MAKNTKTNSAKNAEEKNTNNANRNRGSRRGGSNPGKEYPKIDPKSKDNLKCVGSEDNDPAWYMHNAEMFGDATRYWISKVTGTQIDWNKSTLGAPYLSDVFPGEERTPGIMTLDWIPSTGVIARDDSYPIDSDFTVAAKNMYNFITHANSRSSVGYEAADLIIATLAADSIFSAIASCVRAYGIARTIVQENRYYGEAMLEALGFVPSSVIDDLAAFREQINYYVALASTIWVPSDIDLIKRHYWMNTNIYSDSLDVTGQLYAYKQKVYYQWTPKTSTNGSELTPIVLTAVPQSAQAWFTMIRNLIFAILDDDDPQTMMGDMLKAYGADRLFALQPISPDYTVVPSFNNEVLLQMHNTDFAVLPNTVLATCKISQNVNNMCVYQHYDQTVSDVQSITNKRAYYGYRAFDFPSGYKIDPAAVMVASRNKNYYDMHSDSGIDAPWIYCGSECFTTAYIWFYKPDGSRDKVQFIGVANTPGGIPTQLDYCGILARLSKFDFAPFMYSIEYLSDGSSKLWAIHGANNQGRPLSRNNMRRLHQVAILSELNVPYMK